MAGAKHLNGHKGKISHWNEAKERWAVVLQGQEEAMAVKAENLQLIKHADLAA
jgi:hypothetical protein